MYTIIKLGGSVITKKNSDKPILKVSLIKKIGKKIHEAQKKNKDLKLILLHGAGSFGHPLVHKYDLKDQPVSPKNLEGYIKTVTSMKKMNLRLAEILQEENISVVPMQTSSMVEIKNNEAILHPVSNINHLLNSNCVPILSGDILIDDKNCYRIISADKLITMFANLIPTAKILIASDVEGVYESFPPNAGDGIIDVLNRRDILQNTSHSPIKASSKDVTGAMGGKLKELLSLRNREAIILDGRDPDNIEDVLTGQKRGTLIKL